MATYQEIERMNLGFLYIYSAGVMLFTPWVWLDIDILQSGGIQIELTNPREIGFFGPKMIGHINFLPHSIGVDLDGFSWVSPKSLKQWREGF
jgi:hypothetical protein